MTPALVALFVNVALGGVLVAIAAIDLRSQRIPDWLSLPLIAAGLAWAGMSGDDFRPHAIGALVGFGGLAAFGAIYFRARGREGLGLGDAKLFGAAGAWLGWSALPFVLGVAAVGGLLYARLTGTLHPDRRLAFGPWLALGFWVCWLASR